MAKQNYTPVLHRQQRHYTVVKLQIEQRTSASILHSYHITQVMLRLRSLTKLLEFKNVSFQGYFLALSPNSWNEHFL